MRVPSLLRRYGLVICAGAYTALLIVRHVWTDFPSPGAYDLSHLIGTPVLTVEGRVANFPLTRWGQTRFLLEGRAIPLDAFHGRILVTLQFPLTALAPDEIVRVRGWTTAPRAAAGRRAFDEKAYWASQRTYTVLRVTSPDAVERVRGSEHQGWTQRAWAFHHQFRRFWAQRLPPAEAALVCCMTLGSRGVLPTEIKGQFIRAGVYHVPVVSGQNVALIITLAVVLLQALKIPRRRAVWFCFLPILFYTAAVGADPPVTRAAVMAVVVLLIQTLKRDVPQYIPFVLAWLWILWREPEALFGASFQLSFGATASLLVIMPILRRWEKTWPKGSAWILQSVAMSAAVHLGMWPLLAYYFHQVSWVGFIANLTLFPWSIGIMAGGLVLGTWGVYSPNSLPNFLLALMQAALEITLWMTEQASGWPWAVIPVASPAWPAWLFYYGLLICILCLHYRVKKPPHLR